VHLSYEEAGSIAEVIKCSFKKNMYFPAVPGPARVGNSEKKPVLLWALCPKKPGPMSDPVWWTLVPSANAFSFLCKTLPCRSGQPLLPPSKPAAGGYRAELSPLSPTKAERRRALRSTPTASSHIAWDPCFIGGRQVISPNPTLLELLPRASRSIPCRQAPMPAKFWPPRALFCLLIAPPRGRIGANPRRNRYLESSTTRAVAAVAVLEPYFESQCSPARRGIGCNYCLLGHVN
jgi:hypothetical protein